MFISQKTHLYIDACVLKMYVCVSAEGVMRPGGLRTRAPAFAASSISQAICSAAGN